MHEFLAFILYVEYNEGQKNIEHLIVSLLLIHNKKTNTGQLN